MKQKTIQVLRFLTGLFLLISFDQWTKFLAVAKLKDQDPFVIWDGVFEFYYTENRGAAFGMLQDQQLFFFVIGVLVILAAVYLMVRMPYHKKYLPMEVCLFLIAAGAVGNMIDRMRLGYVIDFLYFKRINFPIFNVADCYVTVATGLVLILTLCYYKDEDLEVFYWKRGSR